VLPRRWRSLRVNIFRRQVPQAPSVFPLSVLEVFGMERKYLFFFYAGIFSRHFQIGIFFSPFRPPSAFFSGFLRLTFLYPSLPPFVSSLPSSLMLFDTTFRWPSERKNPVLVANLPLSLKFSIRIHPEALLPLAILVLCVFSGFTGHGRGSFPVRLMIFSRGRSSSFVF